MATPELSRRPGGRGAVLLAGVCLAGGCHHESATTPSSPSPAPPTVTLAPAPAPSLRPVPTQPVSLSVKVNPNPPSGVAPFSLGVSLCGSRPSPPVDDFPLTFTLDWGDGRRHTRYFCRDDHVYETPGVFRATFCATDGIEGHETCASVRVKVS